jgi:hypothetical protein
MGPSPWNAYISLPTWTSIKFLLCDFLSEPVGLPHGGQGEVEKYQVDKIRQSKIDPLQAFSALKQSLGLVLGFRSKSFTRVKIFYLCAKKLRILSA